MELLCETASTIDTDIYIHSYGDNSVSKSVEHEVKIRFACEFVDVGSIIYSTPESLSSASSFQSLSILSTEYLYRFHNILQNTQELSQNRTFASTAAQISSKYH
ncbi:hypothetical protein E2986_13890 [Frieseomelitta varia]|uniref:Uncharacterized protein n=1 Tax=Frieseomelitta varia TaxID=561572 RepID=A0A833RVZ3_9HYME|nr:hypothetical protein E2986_13890 [Frieseomelitta varia]